MVNGGFYDCWKLITLYVILGWYPSSYVNDALWWLMMDFMMVNNSLLSMLSWDDIQQAMLMMVYNG